MQGLGEQELGVCKQSCLPPNEQEQQSPCSQTPEFFPSCSRLVLQQDGAAGASGDGALGKELPPCRVWRHPLSSPQSKAVGRADYPLLSLFVLLGMYPPGSFVAQSSLIQDKGQCYGVK